MLFRKTVFVLALVSASIPAAFANSGSTFVGGEMGFQSHPVKSDKSRADVKKESEVARANPVTADGGKLMGGEAGSILPQHSHALQGGKLVHTDTIPHNTSKPSLATSDVERRLLREQYVN